MNRSKPVYNINFDLYHALYDMNFDVYHTLYNMNFDMYHTLVLTVLALVTTLKAFGAYTKKTLTMIGAHEVLQLRRWCS